MRHAQWKFVDRGSWDDKSENQKSGKLYTVFKRKGESQDSYIKAKMTNIWPGAHLTSVFAKSFKLRCFFSFLFLLWECISNFIMEIISERKLYDKFLNWCLLVNIYNWNRFSLSWHSVLGVYIFVRQ